MKSYCEILKLVWPLALGMINNAVMQFVDRAYLAADSLGALEAVLPAGMLMWIFAGFFQSVVGYSSVLVGQYHGAGEDGRCRETYRITLWLSLAFGALSVPLVFLGNWFLGAVAGSPQLLADERSYFSVMMAGSVFVYGQMAAASYFTGRGKTRIVFWVNLLGNVLNIALDPFLIFGWCGLPAMGIAGAAIVSVFAMAVQMAVLVGFAHREAFSRPGAGECRRKIVGTLLRYGVPSGVYGVLNCLSFTIFVFITGGVGPLELAVSNACFTVNYLVFAPMEGFAIGASTLVAQACGRGDTAAAIRDARRTIALGVGLVTVTSVLVLVFSGPILSVFASKAGADAAAFLSLGRTLFVLMAVWQVFDATDIILGGALKGAGDTRFVMSWMLFCSFAVWLPLVFVVRHFRNTMPALWATMIVFVVLVSVGSVIRWHRGKWKTHRLT